MGPLVTDKQLPLGIRSHNPGNIRPTFVAGKHVKWQGELAPDPRGYCVFDTPENGIRALALNLGAYQRKHNLRTVETIISRWAPGSENDTESYITDVCKRTTFKRAQRLDLADLGTLKAMTVAIIAHENANYHYPDAVIDASVRKAIPS